MSSAPTGDTVAETGQVEARTLYDAVHAQKLDALGRLTSGIAHDLNNVLTAVLGFGEVLRESLPADHPGRALADELLKAGERGAYLTRQLLAFSRKEPSRAEVVDVNSIVTGLLAMLQRLLGEDIEVVTVLESGLGRVKADVGQLEHVIVNLALNARDAMAAGGTLLLRTVNARAGELGLCAVPSTASGNYVALSLTDTGSGMDAATKARLFEPFFTTKVPGKGTGLGLATALDIVKQAGGRIDVDSELGRGTTVTVCLPQTAEELGAIVPPSGEAPTARPRSAPTAGETVLLVEDDVSVRALAGHVLRSAGYAVVEAGDGGEAVRVCERHVGAVDLLITDVVLPQLGGAELADTLCALRRGMRVLFMSGYPDDDLVRKGVLRSKVAFIQKPFSPTELLRVVREVLKDAAAEAARCLAAVRRG